MISIYKRALGPDFERLHPEVQRRFGFSSENRIAAIGTGIMEKVGHGAIYTLPFLYLGTWRNIMFPAQGMGIPFQIENYAYKDSFGRETITWIRTFHFPAGPRRFDATMIYSDKRRRIVDYLGTHQHLAVDINLAVGLNRGLVLRSGRQRFYEAGVGIRFPMLFSGYAHVCEWYDDNDRRFRIRVVVSNPVWGTLFSYEGWFEVEWRSCDTGHIPPYVRPVREQIRE